MTLKAGVRVLGIRPECVLAAQIARDVFARHSTPFVMTSVIDGVHAQGSLHYTGAAFDLRSPATTAAAAMVEDLRRSLGMDFDVVAESDHIHVEFQPKASY